MVVLQSKLKFISLVGGGADLEQAQRSAPPPHPPGGRVPRFPNKVNTPTQASVTPNITTQ